MKTTRNIAILWLIVGTIQLFAQDDGDYHLDKVYSMDTQGTVYLRSEDAKVRITGSDRNDARVVIDRVEQVRGITNRRPSFEMEIEEKDGDLYVTEKSRSTSRVNIGISVYSLEYDISIELPRNASLKIDGEDDDYLIRSVNGRISIDAEDGDIELLNCQGDDFEITLEDGDLTMDGGNGSLVVEVEDGDLDFRNGNFKEIELVTEDGDVHLETKLLNGGIYDLDGEDATIDFIVLSGGAVFNISRDDARVSASSAFRLTRETDSRVAYQLGEGSAEVYMRTKDGRVRLEKN